MQFATIRRLIHESVKAHYPTADRPWLKEVLYHEKLNFDVVKQVSGAAAKYYPYGTKLQLQHSSTYDASFQVKKSALVHILHELWHAYWDLIAEHKETELSKKIRAEFLKTEKYCGENVGSVDGKRTFFGNSRARGFDGKFGSACFGDPHKEIMADEMWGNYISQILGDMALLVGFARYQEEAQWMWDFICSRQKVYMSQNYMKKGFSGTYDMKAQGKFIREKMLGIPPKIANWPSQWKRFSNFSKATESLILRDSGAHHTNMDTDKVLLKFIKELIRRDWKVKEAHRRAGSPSYEVSKASQPTRSGKVIKIPSKWARKFKYPFSTCEGGYSTIIVLNLIKPLLMATLAAAAGQVVKK